MKKYFIFIVVVLIVLPILYSSAATLESNGTNGGNWGNASSWDGINTPADMADGDTLVIQLGDTITISAIESFNGVIQIYGVLNLDNGKLSMNSTSVIQLASGSNIIAQGTGENEHIIIGNPSNKITSDDINDLIKPNQLTEGNLTGGGCAVTLDCEDDPLPVEILYFKATEQKIYVKIEWATLSEENFDYFTIERSSNGIDFNEYGIVYSKTKYSSIIMKYKFFDENPFPGLSYYRLKATDFDGFTDYHGVVSVNMERVKPDIILYPNPTVDNRIIVSFNGEKESSYKILNVSGDIIKRGPISPGINEILFYPSISNSVYFFNLDSEDIIILKKLIIK